MPGAQVFVFRDRMVEKLDNLVKLETKKHDAGETLVLRNDLYAPVEVELRLERLVNVAGAPDEPIRWVLPPRSHIRLTTLAPLEGQADELQSPGCATPWAIRACSRSCSALPAALAGRSVPA